MKRDCELSHSLYFFVLKTNIVTQLSMMLGTIEATKTDVFSEKFQTAFDPPLIFGKSYCRFRDKNATKVRMFI